MPETSTIDIAAATAPGARRIPVRWCIAILLFGLSALNYLDRQALSILATTIQRELGLTDGDYARVGQAFLLCYTLAYLASGRIVDRIGPRLAETAFVVWWSLANMATAFASGMSSLTLVRSLLGLGEPGHYAVAAKAVGQWFPRQEKGTAAGLYVMGGTLGAAIAAPLVAWLTLHWGWRSAFVITGGVGLVLAMAWWFVYRSPAQHPWLGAAESALLGQHGLLEAGAQQAPPPPLKTLFRWKPLWLILGVRALTDPVWYFYLVWFAKYLQEVRHYTLGDVGSTLWIVFVAADLGCIGAGLLSGFLIRRGAAPPLARMRVMLVTAILLAFSFVIPHTPGAVWPLALAAVFAGCVMLFMASCVALPLDLFPRAALGSAQGIIGMGGSIGGFFSTGLIGFILTKHHSYDAVFTAMSFVHPLSAIALLCLLPRFLRSFSPA